MSQTAEQRYQSMTHAPMKSLILKLSLPTTISMLVTNLYNMADTWFVSQRGTSATGAVGVMFGLMALIQAIGFTCGHGAGSNVSRLLGARNVTRAREFAATGFYLSLALGGCITVLGLLFLDPLCRLLGSTSTILPYARTYAFFILLAAPGLAASCVMNNLLRYEGCAALAMVGLCSGSILNIGGDALFIHVFHMGVFGAGLSTAISQYVSFGILLSFFLSDKTQCDFSPRHISRNPADYLTIPRVGCPSLLRQGLISVSTMALNGSAAIYGDAAIAAMSVVSRIANFLYSMALGIGQGAQPVFSFNYGAKRYARVRQAAAACLQLGIGCMAVLSAAAFLFCGSLLRAFLTEPAALDMADFAMRAQCLTLIFVPISICGSMLFQALGLSGRAALISSLRSGLAFIPLLLLFAALWGMTGIQLAQPAADIVAAAVSAPLMWRFLRRGLPPEPPAESTL